MKFVILALTFVLACRGWRPERGPWQAMVRGQIFRRQILKVLHLLQQLSLPGCGVQSALQRRRTWSTRGLLWRRQQLVPIPLVGVREHARGGLGILNGLELPQERSQGCLEASPPLLLGQVAALDLSGHFALSAAATDRSSLLLQKHQTWICVQIEMPLRFLRCLGFKELCHVRHVLLHVRPVHREIEAVVIPPQLQSPCRVLQLFFET